MTLIALQGGACVEQPATMQEFGDPWAGGTDGFTDDAILRNDLPKDVFGILHDLCYHHAGRDVNRYVERAKAALSVAAPEATAGEYNPDWPSEQKQAYADHMAEYAAPIAPAADGELRAVLQDFVKTERAMKALGLDSNGDPLPTAK